MKGERCMEKLKSVEQFEQLKNEERTMFYFSADWCPDCRVIEPILPVLWRIIRNINSFMWIVMISLIFVNKWMFLEFRALSHSIMAKRLAVL